MSQFTRAEIDNWYNHVLTSSLCQVIEINLSTNRNKIMVSNQSEGRTADHPKGAEDGLQDGVLVAWYGDDFTGASAVMEVLAFAGLPSMLFLDVPTQAQLDRYPGLRGIGIASTARAQTPSWMDAELPNIFEHLAKLNPALVHYKVCSTLDSSPEMGSIGRAIEIASDRFTPDVVPVLIAAPQMRRYQCFGHLFAGLGDTVYRLDRHPVMARHPVTPMTESDVAAHIERQSGRLDLDLVSLEALASGNDTLAPRQTAAEGRITVATLDCLDAVTEAAAGRLIWQGRKSNPFVVGSQGVEYALVQHWRGNGYLAEVPPPSSIGRAQMMVTVSASVSPTTADQIAWSSQNGFACIPFDAACACGADDELDLEITRVVDMALNAIAAGQDPLVYTAEGPDDPAVARYRQAVGASQRDLATTNRMIGEALGRVLHRVLERSGATRAVVSGGDTSGYATQQLGIFALSALAPTIPGASIFKTHATGQMDGLELALKGGQMGSPDYFGWVRDGGGKR
ncbi:MAG: four-carbon acid sugar kinase family protein [Candidatus Thiodiazotropha sp.]